MQRSNATVAVVIPVFRATFLSQCLDSVQAQPRRPDEVVVVDDGSPDRAVVEAVAARHGPLRVIRQPNAGAGAARNRGIAATRADLIARALTGAGAGRLPGQA